MQQAVGHRARVVDATHGTVVDRISLCVVESHAEVPLSEQRGGVTVFAQHFRQGQQAFLDQAGPANTGKHATESGTERHRPVIMP